MLFESVISDPGSSFCKKNFLFKYFPPYWHYHPECEILLITEGFGKRFVGSGVTDFKAGDLVIIGSNIPHFHLSDITYYQSNDLFCSSEVIQFLPELFESDSLSMPEFDAIRGLLAKCKRGILFRDGKLSAVCSRKIQSFESKKGIQRLMELYSILDVMSSATDIEYLSPDTEFDFKLPNAGNVPVRRATEYLIKNFKNDLSLKDISEYAGLNSASLCRSFKHSTGKSIFNYLAQVRINFACKLLKNSDFTVSQIAFECGFRTVSNFNRHFKTIMKISPIGYKGLLEDK